MSRELLWELVVNPGTGPSGPIFCKIKCEDGGHRRKILTISGVESPRKGGHANSLGQIHGHFEKRNPEHNEEWFLGLTKAKDIKFTEGWNTKIWYDFLEAWYLHHLNNMNPGCPHQKKLNWGNDKISEPCPTCGYKYGESWLYEPVPKKVWDFLKSLPETKVEPAWV